MLSEIEYNYQLAYKHEYDKLEEKGIGIHNKWYLFFLLAFYENRVFSCIYKNIKSMDIRVTKKLEIAGIDW